MIDVTRLNIPNGHRGSRSAQSHHHERQAGWHRTVNIRVLNSSVWDQIVAAPSLETVRRLQAALLARSVGQSDEYFLLLPSRRRGPAPSFHHAARTPQARGGCLNMSASLHRRRRSPSRRRTRRSWWPARKRWSAVSSSASPRGDDELAVRARCAGSSALPWRSV
jgi:hypothetical protein